MHVDHFCTKYLAICQNVYTLCTIYNALQKCDYGAYARTGNVGRIQEMKSKMQKIAEYPTISAFEVL
ncbi:MAG: hypothetical protein APR55_09700 [Methanolinea sp. SDB]|nr:MAG: hypothetical protein APR55_09700 [Methanolinea sp. SDB]